MRARELAVSEDPVQQLNVLVYLVEDDPSVESSLEGEWCRQLAHACTYERLDPVVHGTYDYSKGIVAAYQWSLQIRDHYDPTCSLSSVVS